MPSAYIEITFYIQNENNMIEIRVKENLKPTNKLNFSRKNKNSELI